MGLQSGDLAGHSIRSMPFPPGRLTARRCRRGVGTVRRAVCSSHRRRVCLYGPQPNARPHRAGVGDQFLDENGIEHMEWPARSTDCNPIENLWDNIKRKANKKVKDDTSLEEFQRILQRACMGQPGSTSHTNFDQQYTEEVSRDDRSR